MPDTKLAQLNAERFKRLQSQFDQLSEELKAATGFEKRQAALRELLGIIKEMDVITDEAQKRALRLQEQVRKFHQK